jgi:hypothetical protein
LEESGARLQGTLREEQKIMPGSKELQFPLTDLEKRILEQQIKKRLGPTEEFWRETFLNKPMESGKVPAPLARPLDEPIPANMEHAIPEPGTEDPMYMYDKAEMETKDPMPFIYVDPRMPSTTYL